MPLFDFKCVCCTEVIEINENIPPACTTCGETMQRVWSAPAVKFNGTGFYSTGGQMETFLIGLMIGVLIGRVFEMWVDWKYKK